MTSLTPPSPALRHVVIGGAGVAGLEALLGLRAIASDRVRLTLLAPDTTYVERATTVLGPFVGPAPRVVAISEFVAAAGATRVAARLSSVDLVAHHVTTTTGEQITYDDLVVAVGAQSTCAGPDVTLTADGGLEAMRGIVQDIEGGWTQRVAFVVPPGVTWALPLYEMVLMTGERAADLCLSDVELTVITTEPAPLASLGRATSAALTRDLREAGVDLFTNTIARRLPGGRELELRTDGQRPTTLVAQRVVTAPVLHGPAIPGLATNADGFIEVDEEGRVRRARDAWAAGDATDRLLKSGAEAVRQADRVVRGIARGLDIAVDDAEPDPEVPLVLGGTGSRRGAPNGTKLVPGYLRDHLSLAGALR